MATSRTFSPQSGQFMNISNSDRVKKWIGASSAGPRGPATRASRLSVTGVCLGKELHTSRLRPTPPGTRKTR